MSLVGHCRTTLLSVDIDLGLVPPAVVLCRYHFLPNLHAFLVGIGQLDKGVVASDDLDEDLIISGVFFQICENLSSAASCASNFYYL